MQVALYYFIYLLLDNKHFYNFKQQFQLIYRYLMLYSYVFLILCYKHLTKSERQ